jgi:uncharacterized protein with HEPN domain
MKDDRFYLIPISECLADIAEYTSDGLEAFMSSRLIQDAVLRKLQVMVQSSMRLSDTFREAHSERNRMGLDAWLSQLCGP